MREGGRREGRREEEEEEGRRKVMKKVSVHVYTYMSSRQRGKGGGKLINTNHPGTTSKERKGLGKHCILHMYIHAWNFYQKANSHSCTRTYFPLSLRLFDFYVSVL